VNDKDALYGQTNFGLVLLISCVATIGGFLFGFDSGVINGTVPGLQAAFNSDSVGTGFNVASMLLGCAAGAFFAGRLADHWGRRTLLILSAVFYRRPGVRVLRLLRSSLSYAVSSANRWRRQHDVTSLHQRNCASTIPWTLDHHSTDCDYFWLVQLILVIICWRT
jgi:MFS family permease